MKKTLSLLLVCSISANLLAQKVKTGTAPVVKAETDLAPLPPPPPPKQPARVKFTPPVINEKGYNLTVHYNNGSNIIYAKKKGVNEKIPMMKWVANESYYKKSTAYYPHRHQWLHKISL